MSLIPLSLRLFLELETELINWLVKEKRCTHISLLSDRIPVYQKPREYIAFVKWGHFKLNIYFLTKSWKEVYKREYS